MHRLESELISIIYKELKINKEKKGNRKWKHNLGIETQPPE